jgi:DUF1009 family protein
VTQGTLGLIAGRGLLPESVIRACLAEGRPIFVVSVASEGERQAALADVPHACLPVSSVGKAVALLKKAGARDLLMLGGVARPRLSELRPDAKGLQLLARLAGLKRAGDNDLLSAVLAFLEEQGFRILKVQDALPSLLAPAGAATRLVPDARDMEDIRYAAEAARALGRFDIGQSVAVEEGVVLAVEGPEGTDALIARAGSLRLGKRGPILVKTKKPGQDDRVDLPAVGVTTILNARRHGFRGLAVEAGQTLLPEREETLRTAEEAGMFIWGTTAERFC